MYISKIIPSISQSKISNDRKVKNPSFGYRTVPTKPLVENESGRLLFDKLLKLIRVIPEKGKTQKPVTMFIGDNSYGILIDRTNPSTVKVDIKNITESKNWNEIKEAKDIFAGVFDSKTGKMLRGSYDEINFYRNLNKRTRRMQIGKIPFSPESYSSDNWGPKINSAELNKDTLGSIFWAMTKQTSSILPR